MPRLYHFVSLILVIPSPTSFDRRKLVTLAWPPHHGGRDYHLRWSDLPAGFGICNMEDMIFEKNPRDRMNRHTESLPVFGFHSNVVLYLSI
jgi:hypothetical protein